MPNSQITQAEFDAANSPEGTRLIEDFVKRDEDKFNQIMYDTCQLLNVVQIVRYLNKFEVEVITTLIEAKVHISTTLGQDEVEARTEVCNHLINGIAMYRDNINNKEKKGKK